MVITEAATLVQIDGENALVVDRLLFAPDELEPGYVHGVVRDTVERFGF